VKHARLKAALVATLLDMAGHAHSADSLWIITGDVYPQEYYAAVGALIPLPGSVLGRGWVQRYWIDSYTYSYASGPSRIDASVWGAEPCWATRPRAPAWRVPHTWVCATRTRA
jgi:hypothetical protein